MRQQLRELGLVPVDQLVAIAERQLVVGVDVQPPQQFLFPRRQRLGTNRLDVDEGHQAQHLQPLLETDQGGELLDDLGIFRVAMKGRARHPEVMPDQEVHDLGVFGRDPEALQHLVRHADAFDRVLLVAPLADVVEQQRQDEQLRRSSSARMPLKRSREDPEGVASRSRLRIVSSVCSSTVYLW